MRRHDACRGFASAARAATPTQPRAQHELYAEPGRDTEHRLTFRPVHAYGVPCNRTLTCAEMCRQVQDESLVARRSLLARRCLCAAANAQNRRRTFLSCNNRQSIVPAHGLLMPLTSKLECNEVDCLARTLLREAFVTGLCDFNLRAGTASPDCALTRVWLPTAASVWGQIVQ